MQSTGVENIETKRPDLLFQVYGEPPTRPYEYDLKYTESDLDVSSSDEMIAINAKFLDDQSDDESIDGDVKPGSSPVTKDKKKMHG